MKSFLLEMKATLQRIFIHYNFTKFSNLIFHIRKYAQYFRYDHADFEKKFNVNDDDDRTKLIVFLFLHDANTMKNSFHISIIKTRTKNQTDSIYFILFAYHIEFPMIYISFVKSCLIITEKECFNVSVSINCDSCVHSSVKI